MCHWNLSSIAANDFSKLCVLETNNTHHMYDINCLSKRYLDSSVPYGDSKLNLSGYKLVRGDNLSNIKMGGVFVSKKP